MIGAGPNPFLLAIGSETADGAVATIGAVVLGVQVGSVLIDPEGLNCFGDSIGAERGNRPLHRSDGERRASGEHCDFGDAGAIAEGGNEVRRADSIGLQESRIAGILRWDDFGNRGVVEGPDGIVDERAIFIE